MSAHPRTPDGRYFVVRGRLWRCTDPRLPDDVQTQLRSELMKARSAVSRALKQCDAAAEREARARVRAAKLALGERGAPWWGDGAPDYNRRMARNTPYRDWFHALQSQGAAVRATDSGL